MNEIPIKQPPENEQAGWNLIFVCWIIAAVATLGSLFFSEVMGLKPCVLCWYQRIFMYPLVVILLVGMFPLDKGIVRYALPLAVIGWIFAVYHYLLYSGYIPESLQPCDQDASCAEINLELFGFITIPMLSILSFTAIIALLIVFRKLNNQNNANQSRI
jgi:disulfide bond formation protein DsbB